MSVPKCYRPGPKPPKLSDLQQRERLKMHATGEYSISDLGRRSRKMKADEIQIRALLDPHLEFSKIPLSQQPQQRGTKRIGVGQRWIKARRWITLQSIGHRLIITDARV